MKTLCALIASGILFVSFAESDTTVSRQEASIEFDYDILNDPDPANPMVAVDSHRVAFSIVFVEIACEDHDYEFERKDNRLILTLTASAADCDRSENTMYGVEGKLANVPKGSFLFTLMMEAGPQRSTVFQEWIEVE
ncbi:MAG: hypothetical protein GF398_10995 [Chitinivibrionales bacterium]|nr:hypothetical protein [Chitinivibrionales bacterium]